MFFSDGARGPVVDDDIRVVDGDVPDALLEIARGALEPRCHR